MRAAEIDGIPVYHYDAPGESVADLVFNVGTRDETFLTMGVTRLLAALAADRGTPADVDVTTDCTRFTVRGTPGHAASALKDLCDALRAPPTERLEARKQAVRADSGGDAWSNLLVLHLLQRYGLRGLGIAGLAEPALEDLTAEQVCDWAARRFVAENAALALSGPWPEGLALPLAHGSRLVREEQPELPGVTPGWFQTDHARTQDSVIVSISFPWDFTPAGGQIMTLARDRLRQRLPRGRDKADNVGSIVSTTHGLRSLAVIHARTPRRQAVRTVRALDHVLRELATRGPQPAELSQAAARQRRHAGSMAARHTMAVDAAWDHLAGNPVHTQGPIQDAVDALTPDDVRAMFAGYPAGALFVVPGQLDPQVPGFHAPAPRRDPAVTGTSFRSRRWHGRRLNGRLRLTVGAEGVSEDHEDGRITVPWDKVVGLGEREDGMLTLYRPDGPPVGFHPTWYRDGEAAAAAIRARVPAHLRFTDRATD